MRNRSQLTLVRLSRQEVERLLKVKKTLHSTPRTLNHHDHGFVDVVVVAVASAVANCGCVAVDVATAIVTAIAMASVAAVAPLSCFVCLHCPVTSASSVLFLFVLETFRSCISPCVRVHIFIVVVWSNWSAGPAPCSWVSWHAEQTAFFNRTRSNACGPSCHSQYHLFLYQQLLHRPITVLYFLHIAHRVDVPSLWKQQEIGRP